MWPFKRKEKPAEDHTHTKPENAAPSVANGIDWRQILSEGRSVELFDGCRAKCDGTMEDL